MGSQVPTKVMSRYQGVTPGDAAAVVRAISNTDNGNIEFIAAHAAVALTVSERARFVERLCSIAAAVTERMTQTT